MITPSIRGGHEVCQPVAVDGAKAGDAVVIRIKDIEVNSLATSSGNDQPMEVASTAIPSARRSAQAADGVAGDRVEGVGRSRCAARAAARTARRSRSLMATRWRSTSCARSGVTVPRETAERFPRGGALRGAARQLGTEPILGFAPHDIVALATRLRPFMGQLGTPPSTTMPDSHNAGDFGSFLVGAPHRYALDAQELQRHKTDGHMDIDAVRAGAILVCPVSSTAPASTSATCTRCRATGRSPGTPATCPAP